MKPVYTHVGGPASKPSLKNTAKQLPGKVDGTQKDQLCFIFYITFKTRISFMKHMKRGAPRPEDVKGGFVREFMMLLNGTSVGGQSKQERDGSPL